MSFDDHEGTEGHAATATVVDALARRVTAFLSAAGLPVG
jgi:hypothetical protein